MSKLNADDRVNQIKSAKRPIGKMSKICPLCRGSGRNRNYIMMVDGPGMSNRKPKKVLPFGACEKCGGTGKVPLIEPIIM